MRKIFVTVILALFATTLVAQNTITDPETKIDFGFDIFTDLWQDLPDGMKSEGISLGNSIYAMYEKQIWNENGRYRIALGAGLTTHKLSSNYYLDSIFSAPVKLKKIEGDYKKSKIVVNYLDFMVELRYKSPSKFRLAIGAKVGFKVGSHIYYKGDHLTHDEVDTETETYTFMAASGAQEKHTLRDIEFTEKMRFGPTLKIGYGAITFNAYYSLSKLFSEDNGPEMYPISVGLTFNPF